VYLGNHLAKSLTYLADREFLVRVEESLHASFHEAVA
jgi:hypothetical protein